MIAQQARAVPGDSITTPNKIYVTNMRVIYKNPKLFGLKAKIVVESFWLIVILISLRVDMPDMLRVLL